jgi:hypothetical protein
MVKCKNKTFDLSVPSSVKLCILGSILNYFGPFTEVWVNFVVAITFNSVKYRVHSNMFPFQYIVSCQYIVCRKYSQCTWNIWIWRKSFNSFICSIIKLMLPFRPWKWKTSVIYNSQGSISSTLSITRVYGVSDPTRSVLLSSPGGSGGHRSDRR